MVYELIFDIFLMAVLAFFFGTSFLIDPGVARKGDILGPTGFPRVIIILSFLIMVYQVFKLVQKMKAEGGEAQVKKAGSVSENLEKMKAGYKKMAICMLFLLVYVAGMQYLGYAVMTFLFVASFAKAIGYKNNKKLLLFSVVITIILVAVFGTLFSITLPRGFGILKELSFYWY